MIFAGQPHLWHLLEHPSCERGWQSNTHASSNSLPGPSPKECLVTSNCFNPAVRLVEAGLPGLRWRPCRRRWPEIFGAGAEDIGTWQFGQHDASQGFSHAVDADQ